MNLPTCTAGRVANDGVRLTVDDETANLLVDAAERRLDHLKEFYFDRPDDEQRRIRRAVRRLRRFLRAME